MEKFSKEEATNLMLQVSYLIDNIAESIKKEVDDYRTSPPITEQFLMESGDKIFDACMMVDALFVGFFDGKFPHSNEDAEACKLFNEEYVGNLLEKAERIYLAPREDELETFGV